MKEDRIYTNTDYLPSIVNSLRNNSGILNDEQIEIKTRTANLCSAIKNEDSSIEGDLECLLNDLQECSNNLYTNSNELVEATDALLEADRALAIAMGGVNNALDNMQNILYHGLALGISTQPVGLAYTLIRGNGDFINGLNGLTTQISDIGTNVSNWWENTKVWWKKTKESKVFKTVVAVGSIAGSGIGITAAWLGATGATIGTFGVGSVSYGAAVAVSAYGANNIANQVTDLYRLWNDDEKDDDLIGTTNYLRDGAKIVGGTVGEAVAGDEGRRVMEHVAVAGYYVGETFSTVAVGKAISGIHKVEQGAAAIKNISTATNNSKIVVDTTKDIANNATKGLSKVEKFGNTAKKFAVDKIKDDIKEKALEASGFKDSKNSAIREGLEVFGELSNENAENVENYIDATWNMGTLLHDGISVDSVYSLGESLVNVIPK